MQDLSALVLHFHLLGRISVFEKIPDLRDQIVGDLIREYRRRNGPSGRKRRDLLGKLGGTARAGARYRLIGGDRHGQDLGKPSDGIHSDKRHDGRAVRIGDDAAVKPRILRIDLRDHKRHAGRHAECAGIVDKYSARRRDMRRIFLCQRIRRRAENEIHTGKGMRTCFPYGKRLAPKRKLRARASCAGKRDQVRDGKIPFFQYFDHFASYGARCAEDGDSIFFHDFSPFVQAAIPLDSG